MRRKPSSFFFFSSSAAVAVLAVALGVACTSSDAKSDSSSSGGVDGASGSSGASGTNASSSGASEDPGDTTPRVRYVGRVDRSDPAGPRLGWGGTSMIVRFRGSGMRVKLSEHNIDEGPSGYDVFIDKKLKPEVFVPADGESSYDIATGLAPAQEHVVEMVRRTESMVAVTQILGVEFPDGGELLAPPSFPNRRIEFLGDSESTGYGVECGSQDEHFTGATENARKAFPTLVGQTLGAEIHNVSYSGKGVLRNQDDNGKDLAASFYLQSISANGAGSWTFAAWKPDVVWIALGGNDYDIGLSGDRPPPDQEQFQAKYSQLVDLVRAKNPEAQIVCAVQGMLNDVYPPGYSAFSNAKAAIKAVVAEKNAAGDKKVQYHEHPRANEGDLTGCDSHPNETFHKKAAASVSTKIGALMGW